MQLFLGHITGNEFQLDAAEVQQLKEKVGFTLSLAMERFTKDQFHSPLNQLILVPFLIP